MRKRGREGKGSGGNLPHDSVLVKAQRHEDVAGTTTRNVAYTFWERAFQKAQSAESTLREKQRGRSPADRSKIKEIRGK